MTVQLEDKRLMEDKVACSILPLTWDWLAGFWQAEGSIVVQNIDYGVAPKLSISQKSQEILYRIALDLGFGSIQSLRDGTSRYNVTGWERVGFIVHNIIPYLVANKREQVLRVCGDTGVPVVNECLETMSWDFLVGFWEGDGSLSHDKTSNVRATFSQKDPTVLYEIKKFLNCQGSVRKVMKGRAYEGYSLNAGVICNSLLTYCRSTERRVQLVVSLAALERL